MIARCHNPKNWAYQWYGARGISVCVEWRESLEKFVIDMGLSDGRQIERKDNSLGYFKENCTWVDAETQANNRRSNTVIEWNGRRQTIAQWSRETGIRRWSISRRLHAGLPLEIVLGEPNGTAGTRYRRNLQ